MIHNKEIHSLIYVKENSPKVIHENSQTEILREQTNKSIRELGNKYYQIKNILEQINIRRDVLYDIGKKLEEEYKKTKYIKPLKAKNRRMKDSLFCWFAENFYFEIMAPNSFIVEKIKQYKNNQNCLSTNNNEMNEIFTNTDTNQIITNVNDQQKNDVFYVINNYTNIYLYL